MVRLTNAQIDAKIRSLKGWKRKGRFIVKEYVFDEFMDGIKFVNSTAEIAEKMDHHPDIHVRWTTVRLEIQTHDEGGVTARDIKLASTIDSELGGSG